MDSGKGKIIIIRVLAATGMVLAMVSLVHFVNLILGVNQDASFCNINSAFNCDAVNESKWSSFLGTPLAAYGGAFYLFIFLISFLKDFHLRRLILLTFSFVATLMSVFLFYISEFVIGTLCILCVGMYLINFTFLIISFKLKGAKGENLQWDILTSLKSNGLRLALICAFSSMFLFNVTRVFSVYLLNTNDFYRTWSKAPLTEFAINDASVLQKDYFKGPSDAPITVVEFSDLECSACRNFYLTLENMLPAYKDKIKIVFKNYPLDKSCNNILNKPMHLNACYAAEFSRCAGEQGKFWESLNYIFNLDYSTYAYNRNLIKESLDSSYTFLSLDKAAILECLASGRQMKKIQADLEEGQAMGLHATPSIWINGRKITTSTEESLRSIFNGILHRK